MKKLISILCIAATLLTACESFLGDLSNNNNGNTTTVFCFGEVEVKTTATTATITTEIPFATVNGELIENTTFELEYRESKSGMSYADVITVENYKVKNGNAIFELKNLEPDTDYYATIILYAGIYGIESSDGIVFRTTEEQEETPGEDDNGGNEDDKEPTCELSGRTKTEAAGVYTMLTLEELNYLVDGKATEIDNVVVKYSLKNLNEWTKIVVDGSDIDSSEIKVRIPEDESEYLNEKSEYNFYITVTPSDDRLEPMSSKIISFETRAANVSAEISTPKLSIEEDMLKVDVEKVVVKLDGLSFDSYPDCNYYIYYRKAGSSEWENMTSAVLTDKGMRLDIPVASFTPGVRYQFCGAIIAGANKSLCTSNVAEIIIPKEGSEGDGGNDNTPVTPEPPATGDSDTTTIAGTWHLAEWHSSTPDFDIYLDITEDGIVTLYQLLSTYNWQTYYSTVVFEDNIITGTYTDNTPWSTSYSVTVEGDTMTWLSTTDENDVSVYERSTLPNIVGAQATRTAANNNDTVRFL